MWCVISTETGIQCEASNPARIIIGTYEKQHEAGNALRRLFADKASSLSRTLEYAEYTGREARLFGDMTVIVIAMSELPDPADGEKEVAT